VKYVAYYRTKKPKSPNFNLDAQRQAAEKVGPMMAEFIERETRRAGPRPEFTKAVEYAKQEGAILVIPKLDRLSRNPSITNLLMESGIEFICLDQPTTNRNTIHILAAVADDEMRERTRRVKDAFAKQKAQGVKLGSARPEHWKGREHKRGWKKAVKVAAEKREQVAKNAYQYLMPTIRQMREEGKSLAEIVEWLNNNGHRTTALKPFTQTAVWRIIKRYLGDEYLGPIKSKDHPLAHVVASANSPVSASA
jgi:DNA invertase Pin-like site-specific DNA recombinase